MTKHNGEVVGFTFQEIPLDEAINAILAGDGNYAPIKQMLLQKLPSLAPDKAFAFGLPDGKEVDEDHRRGICMTLNATLKKAQLPWRITYSGIKKLFICVPRSAPRTYTKHSKDNLTGNGHLADSQAIKTMEDIIAEASRKFKVTPKLIQKGEGKAKAVRKAICIVAIRRNIAPRIVAPFVGISRGGVQFNSRQDTAFGKKETAELQAALGR